jgi:hypothetical protein
MQKEKLTEKLNAITVSKSVKDAIIKIADKEEIQIQQVCRKLLSRAIKDYLKNNKKEDMLVLSCLFLEGIIVKGSDVFNIYATQL